MIKKIIITGPESSGKSTLAKQLAEYYDTVQISEYAREYIEKLNGKYTYDDVVKIAKKQIEQLSRTDFFGANKFVFFDTGLIITKVWFEVKYQKVPDFLIKELNKKTADLYLLCYPDINWIPDKTRENGGKARFVLYEKYLDEIKKYQFNYFIIKGKDNERLYSAVKFINSAYSL